jgi:uncharacterized protein (TIGR02453 family)
MGFRGWPPEAVDFFDGLEEDNSKAYWQAHKDTYDRCVRGPLDQLLAELAPEFGPGKVFRPYRDVRFSKDKAPYKTNIAAMVGPSGYVSLSAAGLGVGAGYYHMATDQLDRYRQAVAGDATGAELDVIAADLRRQRYELVAHDTLKTAPKGYPRDHPRIELLRHKGLVSWRQWPVANWLGSRKAKDRVVDALRASLPLQNWLAAHVGPSTLE